MALNNSIASSVLAFCAVEPGTIPAPYIVPQTPRVIPEYKAQYTADCVPKIIKNKMSEYPL